MSGNTYWSFFIYYYNVRIFSEFFLAKISCIKTVRILFSSGQEETIFPLAIF